MKNEKKKFLSGVVLDFVKWVAQQEANKKKWLNHSYFLKTLISLKYQGFLVNL